MQRVLVIGPSGAGKSHFAQRLGPLLDLPVIHLDHHYWQPGWTKPDRAAWDAKLQSLLAQDRWVMEGYHIRTLPLRLGRADTVYFLDPPIATCLRGVFERRFKPSDRPRLDLGEGCPEQVSWGLLARVWLYARRYRPELMEILQNAGDQIRLITLHSRTEMDAALADLATADTY